MLAQWFQRGGPTMFWITALLLPLLVIGGIYVVARPQWALWIAGGLAVLAFGFGAYGSHVSSARSAAALDRMSRDSHMTPDDMDRVIDAADAEARLPLEYGGGVAVGAALLLAFGRFRRRRA